MGILIRDIDALQAAERIDIVVLDKTGTITRGKPVVAEVQALDGVPEDELLRLAASAEQYSGHPLAKAIVSLARERGAKLSDVDGFRNEPGLGVVAEIGGTTVLVGNGELVAQFGAAALEVTTHSHVILSGSEGSDAARRTGVRSFATAQDDNQRGDGGEGIEPPTPGLTRVYVARKNGDGRRNCLG